MIEQVHRRLDRLEQDVRKAQTAPTVPIYDISGAPPTNHVLQINAPSIDDFTPILYWEFPVAKSNAWLGFTYRPDMPGAVDHQWFDIYLVFKEYFLNQAYYGALGTGANYIGGAPMMHDPSSGFWDIDPVDVGATPVGSPVLNHYWTGGPAQCDFNFSVVTTLPGPAPKTTRWNLELFVDGTNMVAQQEFDYTPDVGSGDTAFDLIGGIVIVNNYGDSAAPAYFDNIKIGNSQGLDDILAVQDFESGPWGAFTEVDDGSGMVDSFAIIAE